MRSAGDFIFVRQLLARAVVGRDAWQRAVAQPLQLELAVGVGARLRRMGLSDDLRRTLNYDELATAVLAQIEGQPWDSTEQLARRAAALVQARLARGETAQVSVAQTKARLLAASLATTVSTSESSVVEALRGLRLPTIIGVNPLEREHEQIVELDIEVWRKASTGSAAGSAESSAASTDATPTADTTPNANAATAGSDANANASGADGSEVFTPHFVSKLAQLAQTAHFLTVESFANALARALLAHSSVERAVVRAGKPSALNWAAAAEIQVDRTRDDLHLPASATAPAASLAPHPRGHVYLAFGTNMGDRLSTIRASIAALAEAGVHVLQTSGIYASAPMYYTDQGPFYNGVFRCTTKLSAPDLLRAVKQIEYGTFGRVKHFDNGPRTLDLDILLYGDETVDLPDLQVPHIDMLNRSFVLTPLNDVMPTSTAARPAFPEAAELGGTERWVLPLHWNPAVTSPDVAETALELDATVVMAIMNATPDSFSDGGVLLSRGIAETAQRHVAAGARILDVGGQSTRPRAPWVGVEEETRRVVDAVRAIRSVDPRVAISVDTCFGDVARAALAAGANIVNEVFSGRLDPSIFTVAAETGAPLVLMHSRGDPETMGKLTAYPRGLITEVAEELRERVDAALAAGVREWQLVLDPGLGFAKTQAQNIALVRDFAALRSHDALTRGLPALPWLVGPSRKGFVGALSGAKEPRERMPGTLAVLTALRQQGAQIMRVHDSLEACQAMRVADAIYS